MNGRIYQYFLYTAWGESIREYDAVSTSAGFDSPFRFNGKELDQETGLAYYGARYYQNRYSVWLGVDPWASKYPHVTPYNFDENNPIMLVDPDGNGPWQPDGCGGWVAQKGDGAETLARDAGISREEAYYALEQQGHGTYAENGVIKSAVDPGDVVQLGCNSTATISSTKFQSLGIPTRGLTIRRTDNLSSITGPLSLGLGLAGDGFKGANSTFRLSTSTRGFSPKLYPSGWYPGNQFTSTFKLSRF